MQLYGLSGGSISFLEQTALHTRRIPPHVAVIFARLVSVVSTSGKDDALDTVTE